MENIPRSCKPNNQTFQISDIFKKPKVSLDISLLFPLINRISSYCSFNTKKSCDEVFRISTLLLNFEAKLEESTKLLLKRLKLQTSCHKCLEKPKNPVVFPYHFCNTCLNEISNQSKPRCCNCLCYYQKEKYMFACQHQCIFCVALYLRKGGNACPICKLSFDDKIDEFKSQKILCFGCNSEKMFVDDSIMRLFCGHFHCRSCLLEDITNRRCINDNKELKGHEINYVLDFVVGKCKSCGVRKKREKMVVKNCCFFDVCRSCQIGKGLCLGCKIKDA